MDPRSEVLLRQPELFQGSVLLAGLPADDLLGRLPDAHGWCWHAGDQAALDARFPERSHFGVDIPARGFDSAVVFLPKAKDLTDYILNAVASRVPVARCIWWGKSAAASKGLPSSSTRSANRASSTARGIASCGRSPLPTLQRPSPWKAWPRPTSCRWRKAR